MPNIALSDARVKALRPRPSAYDIRDTKLRGVGVRVLPSGAKRFFIHIQHRGTRVWKIVGDANDMTLAEARTRAASILAAIRCDALRNRRRDRVPALCAGVETANAVCESELPAPADSAPVRGNAHCRHHPRSRTALVRLASGHPRRRRPLHARPLGHHDRGQAHGLPPRGLQSLPGDTTLPSQGMRAVSVRCGDWPPCGNALGARGRTAASGGRVRLLLLAGCRKSEVLKQRANDPALRPSRAQGYRGRGGAGRRGDGLSDGALVPAPGEAQPRKHRRCDNGAMTKSQLIERIARKQSHLVERDVALAVNRMLEHMTARLAGGGRIETRSFGSFTLRFRRADRPQPQDRNAGIDWCEACPTLQAGDAPTRARRSGARDLRSAGVRRRRVSNSVHLHLWPRRPTKLAVRLMGACAETRHYSVGNDHERCSPTPPGAAIGASPKPRRVGK